MLSFDHKTYTRLLRTSTELAKQYRIDCGLDMPERVEKVEDVIEGTDTESEVVAETEVALEAVEEPKKEYSRDELKELLNNAEVQYFK